MNIWAAILLGVICFWLGQGGRLLYIGSDEKKYNKALIGILRKN